MLLLTQELEIDSTQSILNHKATFSEDANKTSQWLLPINVVVPIDQHSDKFIFSVNDSFSTSHS